MVGRILGYTVCAAMTLMMSCAANPTGPTPKEEPRKARLAPSVDATFYMPPATGSTES